MFEGVGRHASATAAPRSAQYCTRLEAGSARAGVKAMDGRGSFQPCTLDEGVGPTLPWWEKGVVAASFLVHIVDVGLDILVVFLFLASMQWELFLISIIVVLGAWVVSGLYVSFGSSGMAAGGAVGTSALDRVKRFVLNFTQIQIFTEAFRCVARGGETDYFHTLRLLEALLESAPSALVQLHAIVHWASTPSAPAAAIPLLRASVLASLTSVGLGLAMWEQKVQFRASCAYVVGVAVLRALEVASRTLTLALFSGLTHPYGIAWILALDYAVMLLIVARHRSVHLVYGFFVALPLVLVSLEPFVWRRQDHAVPKDAYYAARIAEGFFMWMVVLHSQEAIDLQVDSYSVWVCCEALAFITTLGLYCLLPFVWCVARRQELSRDVDDWGDETGKELGDYSDSDHDFHSGGEDHDDEASGLVRHKHADIREDELPPE